MTHRWSIFVSSLLLALRSAAAELPDLSTVAADLIVPEMTEGAPVAGVRVRHTTPGWETTEVYGALYLPSDWKPGARFPVLVEWAGNGGYQNAFGDISTGQPEGSKLGYGLTEGKGAIWLCVPYLNRAGTANALTWWGDAPTYDPEPTLAYCRAAVREACDKYGGDPTRVVLAGFSRGAIACNYLGLHDDETAKLWRGFIAYSHYDGVHKWPYADSDRASAAARLQRLGARPQFICGEASNADDTRRYLSETGWLEKGDFTIVGTGFRNHNDAWILRPSEARAQLRAWLAKVLR
jgi:hypothetical protein